MQKTKEKLTPHQIETIEESFELLDGDRDGFVSLKELGNTVKVLKDNIKDIDVDEICKEFNIDSMDFKLYEGFWLMKHSQGTISDEYEDVFRYLDKDKNGFIDARDLLDGLNSLGSKITPEEADEMVIEADLDGDRLIDLDEFRRMMNSM